MSLDSYQKWYRDCHNFTDIMVSRGYSNEGLYRATGKVNYQEIEEFLRDGSEEILRRLMVPSQETGPNDCLSNFVGAVLFCDFITCSLSKFGNIERTESYIRLLQQKIQELGEKFPDVTREFTELSRKLSTSRRDHLLCPLYFF